LEKEKPGHQRQFQTSVLWDTLEASEKTQDDREEHHQDCKKHRRKDTLSKSLSRLEVMNVFRDGKTHGDDSDDNFRERAYPSEPRSFGTDRVDVRNHTDESN